MLAELFYQFPLSCFTHKKEKENQIEGKKKTADGKKRGEGGRRRKSKGNFGQIESEASKEKKEISYEKTVQPELPHSWRATTTIPSESTIVIHEPSPWETTVS